LPISEVIGWQRIPTIVCPENGAAFHQFDLRKALDQLIIANAQFEATWRWKRALA
jgi:hypothetical protein